MEQIKPLKAPGSDDIRAILYHKSYGTIGKSVCRMVKPFFTYGYIQKELNMIYITLILKIDNPDTVCHYGPISLCYTS